MKTAYLIAGMRLEVLASLLRRHGLTLSPRYLGRAAFCAQAGYWSMWMAGIERLLLGPDHGASHRPLDPVIIPSHWRTGTTLVHQLMALDPNLACPTLFQTSMPDSFIVSRLIAEPVLGRAMSGKRPMDNVEVAFHGPQEDEYALLRLTGHSPLTRLIFPEGQGYFLAGDQTFLPDDPAARRAWEDALVSFVARVQREAGGRRVVLKNPFHAMRLEPLLRLFPGARFIHIQRDPMTVIPSTRRMWRIVARDNNLRRGGEPPGLGEVAREYSRITRRLEHDLSALPPGRVAYIRFDELEVQPREVMARAYRDIGLPHTPELDQAIAAFQGRNRTYKKNRYQLTPAEQALIRAELDAS